MALMREGQWQIVTGEETAPTRGGESELAKFASRKDRALASIVLILLFCIRLEIQKILLRFGRSLLISLRRKHGPLIWTCGISFII